MSSLLDAIALRQELHIRPPPPLPTKPPVCSLVWHAKIGKSNSATMPATPRFARRIGCSTIMPAPPVKIEADQMLAVSNRSTTFNLPRSGAARASKVVLPKLFIR
jgi:hypothetical protein